MEGVERNSQKSAPNSISKADDWERDILWGKKGCFQSSSLSNVLIFLLIFSNLSSMHSSLCFSITIPFTSFLRLLWLLAVYWHSILAQDNICIVSVAKGFGKVCPTISVYSTGLSRQCKLVVSLSCDNT